MINKCQPRKSLCPIFAIYFSALSSRPSLSLCCHHVHFDRYAVIVPQLVVSALSKKPGFFRRKSFKNPDLWASCGRPHYSYPVPLLSSYSSVSSYSVFPIVVAISVQFSMLKLFLSYLQTTIFSIQHQSRYIHYCLYYDLVYPAVVHFFVLP